MSTQETTLQLTLHDLDLSLRVRDMTVSEGVDRPFVADLVLRATDALAATDFIGAHATLSVELGATVGATRAARWSGWIIAANDVGGDDAGHRLVAVQLASKIWAMGQNRNYRVFQQMDEVSIVCALLDEWGIPWDLELDPARFPARKLRVQYAESDLAFLTRNLEEVGVTYVLHLVDGEERVVLRDEPQAAAPTAVLRCVDDVSTELGFVWATGVQILKRARPGRYVIADLDWRLPSDRSLVTGAHRQDLSMLEQSLERYHYVPGIALVAAQSSDTPNADDKGAARTSERFAEHIARLRLEAKQSSAERVRFETNDLGVHPGQVVRLVEHRRKEVEEPLLVVATILSGTDTGTWRLQCEAAPTSIAFRPPLATERPRVLGLESATVVGPPGEEVHTDEFGRVRVQFHWDREGKFDDNSSCWIPVSQPWAGAGYGASFLPRVGQEVLVEFLGGDPDRPVITGRVYTNLQRTPYKLPEERSVTVVAKTSSFGGGGGYNEIKADDRAGAELLSIRAERDMVTLVKHDEKRTVIRHKHLVIGGTETREFTSTAPNAPRTVQTNENGLHEMVCGSNYVRVTDAGVEIHGATVLITADAVKVGAANTIAAVSGADTDIFSGGLLNLNCDKPTIPEKLG